MNNNKLSFGSIAALLLSLFFSVIVIFALFAFLKIDEYEAYSSVLIFAIINLLVIILVVSCGLPISIKAGAASYAVICTVTAVYTILQFISLGLCYKTEAVTGYIMFHLILLFIYLLVIIPVSIMGIKNKN